MSIYIHDGRKFRIEDTRLKFSDGSSVYNIFDDEGYILLINFDFAPLSEYQRAVERCDNAEGNLKLVLDFAPVTLDGATLYNLDRHHSIWGRPGCGEQIHAFYKYIGLI